MDQANFNWLIDWFACLFRSVEVPQRSLSLGLQTILLRGLGTVPGPIIFGYLMDMTCLLWRRDSCGKEEGSCLLYDNFSMSFYMIIILDYHRFVGALFFLVALYFNKYSKVPEEEKVDKQTDKEVGSVL